MQAWDETPFALLLSTDRADLARVVGEALRGAGIRFESGLQSVPDPRVVFSVEVSRLEEARSLVAPYFGAEEEAEEEEEEEAAPALELVDREEPSFPWGPVRVALALILVHLVLVLTAIGPHPSSRRLATLGGLVGGEGLAGSWRLVTYIFLHADIQHVVWNGLSMLVFTVPLVASLGYWRTGAIYVAAGVAGGLAALETTDPRIVTIGSSGAVAGLFGTWLLLVLRRARHAPLATHARLRVAGIGLLFLPSLVTPTTTDGSRVSIAAHLGGLAAGAALGWVFSRREEEGRTPGPRPVRSTDHPEE